MRAWPLALVFWVTASVFVYMTHVIGTMKLIVGKNGISVSTLKLTVSQWQRILDELHKEHPRTVFMIREKFKRVLGFTVREHNEWVETKKESYAQPDWLDTGQEGFYKNKHHEHSIRLDFYNERKYTMFMLKFSEYIK